MVFRTGWTVYLLVFICILLSSEVTGQSGVMPCKAYGTVKYKGNSVPDGCEVKALIQGTEYANTKVTQSNYYLSIPADDLSTQKKEGWVQDEYITLKVEGYSGVTLFKAKSGDTNININLTTMGVLNLTTWGKIKALFK